MIRTSLQRMRRILAPPVRCAQFLTAMFLFYLYEKPLFIVWRYLNRRRPVQIGCITPFEDFEITQNGDCYICCPAWLPVPVGNINRKGPAHIFNSVAAQRVRLSLFRENYKFCDRKKCTRLNGSGMTRMTSEDLARLKELNQEAKHAIATRKLHVAAPSRITEAVSEVCNIRCKFCWTPYARSTLNTAALDYFVSYVTEKIDSIMMISFCGGEPLVQKHVKEILRACRGKKVMFYITSNLNVLDDEMKALLPLVNLHILHASLNAACEESYRATIDGGNWDAVLKNLEYVLELRRQAGGKLWLQISMVVTNTNYLDIVSFAKLGVAWGVDRIIYYAMTDYGFPAQRALKLSRHDIEEIALLLEDPVFEEHRNRIEIGALRMG